MQPSKPRATGSAARKRPMLRMASLPSCWTVEVLKCGGDRFSQRRFAEVEIRRASRREGKLGVRSWARKKAREKPIAGKGWVKAKGGPQRPDSRFAANLPGSRATLTPARSAGRAQGRTARAEERKP